LRPGEDREVQRQAPEPNLPKLRRTLGQQGGDKNMMIVRYVDQVERVRLEQIEENGEALFEVCTENGGALRVENYLTALCIFDHRVEEYHQQKKEKQNASD
jgi:hypothetical protein